MMKIMVEPGDIFLTKGNSFISKSIRFFEKTPNDNNVNVNHVGIFVDSMRYTLQDAYCVEALGHVQYHNFWKRYYMSGNKVSIFRPLNLTSIEKKMIANKAISYVGKDYGYIKILAHLGDYFLNGKYFFRKLIKSDNYPICSWVVAHAYNIIGKNFGIDDDLANPENIWDFVKINPDKFKCLYPLDYLRM